MTPIPKVPVVKGALFLKDVLTPGECHQILSKAEAMGFSPDAPACPQPLQQSLEA